MAMLLDEEIPPLEELRSENARARNRAWDRAYKVLWPCGMGVAQRRMDGPQFEQDRRDMVITAIQQFHDKVLSGTTGLAEAWENLFLNEPGSAND